MSIVTIPNASNPSVAFTPAVVGDIAAGTTTHTLQAGRCTKIGSRVFFSLNVVWSNITGASGGIKITGLPFASANLGFHQSCAVEASNLTFTGQLGAQVNNSDTTISITQFASGGALQTVPVDTAADLRLSGSYEAA